MGGWVGCDKWSNLSQLLVNGVSTCMYSVNTCQSPSLPSGFITMGLKKLYARMARCCGCGQQPDPENPSEEEELEPDEKPPQVEVRLSPPATITLYTSYPTLSTLLELCHHTPCTCIHTHTHTHTHTGSRV